LDSAEPEKDPCGDPDLTLKGNYPISGYWMYPRGGECAWREALETVFQVGADTVIQFGNSPSRVTEDEFESHDTWSLCTQDGDSCVDRARTALADGHADNSLEDIYVLGTVESLGASILACPDIDQEVEADDTLFWSLLLPHDNPGDRSCSLEEGQAYDLVVISGQTEDLVERLLDGAEVMGMEVWAGIPTATPHPDYPWDVWTETQPLYLEVLRRVLTDYAERYGDQDSLAGIYHTFELPVSDPTLSTVIDMYTEANEVIREVLPERRILVSPYWDLRVDNENGVTLESIEGGIVAIGETGVDAIAPQDGRGTGKVGLYWDYEGDNTVDERLQSVVGAVTYDEAYAGSTTEAYAAAQRGIDTLADKGRSVELWANLEAFEPGEGDSCSSLKLTTKERMDQAVTFAGTSASKLISFMWDGLYTCEAEDGTTLADVLAEDMDRPIVALALEEQRGESKHEGVALVGVNLSGGTAHLSWYDSDWGFLSHDQVIEPKFADLKWGSDQEAMPDGLERVWMPFDWTNTAPSFWLHISVSNDKKQGTHQYSLAY